MGLYSKTELFAVASDGSSAPVTLSGNIVSGGGVLQHESSPDAQRVVFTADRDANGVIQLYGVPVAGGAPVELSGGLVAGGDVVEFEITPDSIVPCSPRIARWTACSSSTPRRSTAARHPPS